MCKSRTFLILFLSLSLAFASGCSRVPLLNRLARATATRTATPTAVSPSAATQTSAVEETPAGPRVLRVWLPPQFDPSAGSLAGDLLRARLDEFASRHPGVRLEVRVKAQEGSGGLLDALTSTSAAAPQALPDLVALPRPLMEAAALKGLIYPFGGQGDALTESDWYDYARQLAYLQDSAFGVPFAGDALLLIYRPSLIPEPPTDLTSLLKAPGPLSFPAADPLSLYTLSLYQASGGLIQDEQGRPTLEAEVLSQVLTFYQSSANAGLTPDWLSQLERDDQAWQAYQDGRANLLVTWVSRYLEVNRVLDPEARAVPLPTVEGEPFTLATGWVWALANPQKEKQDLSVQLAEFLTLGGFLGDWTAAAGYLPPRASALTSWDNPTLIGLADQVARSARLNPSSDVLSALAPALRYATLQILQGQGDPALLAQEAASRLNNP